MSRSTEKIPAAPTTGIQKNRANGSTISSTNPLKEGTTVSKSTQIRFVTESAARKKAQRDGETLRFTNDPDLGPWYTTTADNVIESSNIQDIAEYVYGAANVHVISTGRRGDGFIGSCWTCGASSMGNWSSKAEARECVKRHCLADAEKAAEAEVEREDGHHVIVTRQGDTFAAFCEDCGNETDGWPGECEARDALGYGCSREAVDVAEIEPDVFAEMDARISRDPHANEEPDVTDSGEMPKHEFTDLRDEDVIARFERMVNPGNRDEVLVYQDITDEDGTGLHIAVADNDGKTVDSIVWTLKRSPELEMLVSVQGIGPDGEPTKHEVVDLRVSTVQSKRSAVARLFTKEAPPLPRGASVNTEIHTDIDGTCSRIAGVKIGGFGVPEIPRNQFRADVELSLIQDVHLQQELDVVHSILLTATTSESRWPADFHLDAASARTLASMLLEAAGRLDDMEAGK